MRATTPSSDIASDSEDPASRRIAPDLPDIDGIDIAPTTRPSIDFDQSSPRRI
jgi:hypothetical protein